MTLDGLSPRRTLLAPLAVAVGVLAATPAAAQVRANVIVRGGDTPAGAPGAVTEVFNPYLNGLDQIGFTGVEQHLEFTGHCGTTDLDQVTRSRGFHGAWCGW